MKLLFVEDEQSKEQKVVSYLTESQPKIEVDICRSITSAVIAIRKNKYDCVLLDMSLPLYDSNALKFGDDNEFDAFGGISILNELDRIDSNSKVIVITAFDILGEGNSKIELNNITENLRRDFPDIFVGAVFYNISTLEWKSSLDLHLNNIWRE